MSGAAGDPSASASTERRQACGLDLDHLRRSTGDDRDLEVELLSLFKVQARVQGGLISMAKLPSDYRRAVHTLKGAALAIGATAIVKTAAELEAITLAGHPEIRRKLIAKLAEEIAAVEAEIERLIG
jgi:HPt (histidine-containing phosphotransfer) domain-containing protein